MDSKPKAECKRERYAFARERALHVALMEGGLYYLEEMEALPNPAYVRCNCPKCLARLQAKIEEMLLVEPASFYTRADQVMRLFETEAVDDVFALISRQSSGPGFIEEFIEYGRKAYLPGGERMTILGKPLPARALKAFRYWLKSTKR